MPEFCDAKIAIETPIFRILWGGKPSMVMVADGRRKDLGMEALEGGCTWATMMMNIARGGND